MKREDCKNCDGTGHVEGICGNCSGSGEGLYDGGTCYVCSGSGTGWEECDECSEFDDEEEE